MKPAIRTALRRLGVGLALDVLGAALTYRLSGRWDMAVIVGAFLLAGHLNDTFGTWLVLRRKLEEEEAGDERG